MNGEMVWWGNGVSDKQMDGQGDISWHKNKNNIQNDKFSTEFGGQPVET